MAEIPSVSRLMFAPLVVESNGTDDIEFWDLPRLPELTTYSSDKLYVLQDEDRPDSIAHKYLGDARLSWVISWFNGYSMPFIDFVTGDLIRIPSQFRLFTDIIQ